jgi:cell division protein FtsL
VERSNDYIYGSAAPKFPQRDEEYSGRQRVQKRVISKPLSKKQIIPKAKMLFAVVFMVAVSFVILYRFSVIAELNYRMGNLTENYKELRDENRKLEVDIATSINLDRVKELAEANLDMHKPDSYQTILVSVPKNNYSVVMDQAYINETTEDTSLMENIINAAKAVLP